MLSPDTTTTTAAPASSVAAASLAPVFFISHGAPTFALEPGRLGPLLQAAGQQLQGVQAVLVVSPHWQTRGVRVSASPAPETVHDFGGFPAPLYALHYPVAGHPALAAQVAERLAGAGWPVSMDEHRGLDHGAWVPLHHLLPDGDVPVFQVSLPLGLNAGTALQLGEALAAVRALGVAVVTTGSMTHNLYEVDFHVGPDSVTAEYVTDFTRWVRQAVTQNDTQKLVDYRQQAPHAQRAHPTEEHFLPLLVAMGARGNAEPMQVLDGGTTYHVLAMESYAWGLTAASTETTH
jgi:4,5-DOPA dioxygenase extradiol